MKYSHTKVHKSILSSYNYDYGRNQQVSALGPQTACSLINRKSLKYVIWL